jgi:hypothetical protein
VGQWWLIPQGVVEGGRETSDEVKAQLESLPGKLVFVATSAEPPQSFFSDLSFGVAGGVDAGLSKAAELIWKKPRATKGSEGQVTPQDAGSSAQVPEI